jgi:hypothetical protein
MAAVNIGKSVAKGLAKTRGHKMTRFKRAQYNPTVWWIATCERCGGTTRVYSNGKITGLAQDVAICPGGKDAKTELASD